MSEKIVIYLGNGMFSSFDSPALAGVESHVCEVVNDVLLRQTTSFDGEQPRSLLGQLRSMRTLAWLYEKSEILFLAQIPNHQACWGRLISYARSPQREWHLRYDERFENFAELERHVLEACNVLLRPASIAEAAC